MNGRASGPRWTTVRDGIVATAAVVVALFVVLAGMPAAAANSPGSAGTGLSSVESGTPPQLPAKGETPDDGVASEPSGPLSSLPGVAEHGDDWADGDPLTTGADDWNDGGLELSADDVEESVEAVLGSVTGAFPAEIGPGIVAVGANRRDGDLLDNDVRASVYEHVEGQPGVHTAELAREADLSVSTLRYHLDVLEREGAIKRHTIMGHRRVFPAGFDEVRIAPVAALADTSTARIVDAVERTEPVRVTELAEVIDRAPSTTSHHVNRLSDAGVLDRQREGRTVYVRLAPATREERS